MMMTTVTKGKRKSRNSLAFCRCCRMRYLIDVQAAAQDENIGCGQKIYARVPRGKRWHGNPP
ncbi:hypothetical protein KCP76_19530 [Salmonella enterica subsp. enterica serovar Weltevreden]|nr:hypothetical protein KCP76_19530 [Salmonella enterica subsp. enterica serovar Weltevreden]